MVFAEFHIPILQLAYISHSLIIRVYDIHYLASKTNIFPLVGLLIGNETKMAAATG